MSRHARNIEQIRNLLRQMDRSIDSARAKREGTGPTDHAETQIGGGATASSQVTPTSGGSPTSQLIGSPSIPAARPQAPANHRPYPTPVPPTNSALDGAPGPNSNSSSQPQRLKAKPKRSSSDPLQDFQQRQAS